MPSLRTIKDPERVPVTTERAALATIGISITLYRSLAQLTLALESVSDQLEAGPNKDFLVKTVADTKKVNAELVNKIDDFLKMVAPEDLDDEQ